MATQFFLPSSGAAAVSPAYDAGWEDTAQAASRVRMPTARTSSAMASVTLSDGNNADRDVLARQFVSDPIAAQTISAQTISLQVRASETNAANNLFVTWLVKVVSNDGSTVRGTCVAIRRDGTEAATSLTNRGDSATSTQVVAQDGDRIVVEIGLAGDPTSSNTHNGDLRFGDSNGTLLPSNDSTTTDNDPWIQFANTITFQTTVTPTVVTATASVGVPSPRDLPPVAGCKLWFDASDAQTITLTSGKVSQWNDKSGSGYHVTQGTAGNRPVVNTAAKNGKDTITFAKANATYLVGSTWTTIAQPLTIFHVVMNSAPSSLGGRVLCSTAPGGFQTVHSDGSAGYRTALVYAGGADFAKGPADAYSTAVWGISEYVVNGASTTAYVNGTAGTTFDAGSNGLATGTIGGRADLDVNLFISGDIAEILVYDSALNSTDRATIRSYLNTKWAVTDAAVATPVVTATVSVGSPAINVPATPSVVTATGSVGAPVIKITATPATVTATATVSVGTIVTSATLTPSVVTAVGSVGSPTLTASATLTPSVVTATGSVGAPVIKITTLPSVVIATASVGAPTATASALLTPSVVTAVVTVGSPTLTASALLTPSAVTAVVTVGAPSITTSALVTPAVVTAVVTVGSPTVSTGASATATPTVVTATVTVGSPTITTTAVVVMSTVTAVGSVGTATAAASALLTPSALVAVVTAGSPTILTGDSPQPAVVTAVVLVGSPTVTATADLPVTTIVVVATVGIPSAAAAAAVAPSSLTVVGSVGAPVVLAASYAGPSVVTAIGLVGTPAITAGATVVPTIITAIASVGVVAVISEVLETVALLRRAYVLDARATYRPDTRADYEPDNRARFPIAF